VGLVYESGPEETGAAEQATFLSRVTVEHLLYVLIFLAAALLRLGDLGTVPLSPAEALEAMAVWDLWNPPEILTNIGSPAYLSATSLLTQALGFRDSVMRLAPAIFGLALVLLPWFLRHRLGRLGALVTSLLLALSPSHTLASRTAGGESIALFAGMLLFVSWLRYQESGNARWFYTLSASLALGLASSSLFFGVAATFVLAWLAQAIVGPSFFVGEDGISRLPHRPDRTLLKQALLMGAGLWLAVSTVYLLNAGGLGASADLVAVWLALFAGSADIITWLSPILAIGRYEIVLLVAGGLAVIWAAVRGRPYTTFLVYWLFTALLLLLLQRGVMNNLLVLTLPGFQLIGRLTDRVMSQRSGPYKWPVIAFVVLAGGVVYFNLVRYSRLQLNPGALSDGYHLFLLLLAVIVVTIVILLVWNWRRPVAQQGVLAGLLILLLIYTWGTAWLLSRQAAGDTRERIVSTASDDDLRLLAGTAEELSWRATGSAEDLHIVTDIDSPALRWYLREFANLEVVSVLPGSIDSQALLTRGQENLALQEEYLGADFGYLRPDTEHILSPQESLRWWLFHESPVSVNEERLVLWLRADLVTGGEQ
jgi:hypothetical protein